MVEAVEEQRSVPQSVLEELFTTRLLYGSHRRKLAGYAASYLRDRSEAAAFPEKEVPMILRMVRILLAIEQYGLDDVPTAPPLTDTPEVRQQMASKFNVGDVVVLKSGGPNMTVLGGSDTESRCLRTAWFNHTQELKYGSFHADALRPATVSPEEAAGAV